ncbi:MAG: sugar phosphate nucleotidyltransferase [Bacteroidaceae bacterium]
MKAMLFAAGMGTRLKPLTDHLPKALVPVNGRPLLDIVLRRLQAAGATQVTINVHHFAQQIINYINTHPYEGVSIKISDETNELLETGGALKKATPILTADGSNRPILIHNVDILSNVDLHEFYTASDNADATLLVSNRETQRYLLFDSKMQMVGWTNIATGEVRSPYPDLRVENCQRFAFSGIHTFSPRLLPFMESWPNKFAIMDFYIKLCSSVKIKGILSPNLRLLDVGKQDSISTAETFLKTL